MMQPATENTENKSKQFERDRGETVDWFGCSLDFKPLVILDVSTGASLVLIELSV